MWFCFWRRFAPPRKIFALPQATSLTGGQKKDVWTPVFGGADKKRTSGHLCLVGPDKVAAHLFAGGRTFIYFVSHLYCCEERGDSNMHFAPVHAVVTTMVVALTLIAGRRTSACAITRSSASVCSLHQNSGVSRHTPPAQWTRPSTIPMQLTTPMQG